MEFKKEKILVILSGSSSFALRDVDILRKVFNVKLLIHKTTKGWRYVWELVAFGAKLIASYISGYNKVFSVFPDSHMLASVLLSKISSLKTYITIGGYEVVANIPEIKFGTDYMPKYRRNIIHYVIRNAFVLLPKTDELGTDASKIRGHSNGIITVFNGYDSHIYNTRSSIQRKPNTMLIVGIAPDYVNFLRKGLDKVIAYAENNTDIHFTIIGCGDAVRPLIPSLKNLSILGTMTHTEILDQYRSHEYFLLASVHEGMPNVLTESIYCGCMPLTYPAGNAAYLVGDENLVLRDDSIATFKKALNYIKNLNAEEKLAIKNRAEQLFDIENRRKKLTQILLE